MERWRVRPTQSANSWTLGTVAERRIKVTWGGKRIRTSSHTTPRYDTVVHKRLIVFARACACVCAYECVKFVQQCVLTHEKDMGRVVTSASFT